MSDNSSNIRWNLYKPISSVESLQYPTFSPDVLVKEVLHHFELAYYTGAHYDGITSVKTNRVPQHPPTVEGSTVFMEVEYRRLQNVCNKA